MGIRENSDALPNVRNRVVYPDTFSPMLGSRMIRENSDAPPSARNRMIGPDPTSPMLGNRTMRENSDTLPGPLRVGTIASTTKPSAASTLQDVSTGISNSLQPQSPASRIFRKPRVSRPT